MTEINGSLAHRRALSMAVSAMALFSTGGLLIKLCALDAIAISGLRSVFAAAILIALSGRPRFSFSRDQIAAAIAYTATMVTFVFGMKLTTSANTTLLQNTAPIYVALLGPYLLGERTTRFDWIMIFTALGGMALFFLDKLSSENLAGNFVAIASGLALALYMIFLRRQKDSSTTESIILGNILSAVICLPFIESWDIAMRDWLLIALLGLFQIGFASYLIAVTIKQLPALELLFLGFLVPILTPVFTYIGIGEKTGPWAIVGGFVVLGAVTMRTLAQRPRAPVEEKDETALAS